MVGCKPKPEAGRAEAAALDRAGARVPVALEQARRARAEFRAHLDREAARLGRPLSKSEEYEHLRRYHRRKSPAA